VSGSKCYWKFVTRNTDKKFIRILRNMDIVSKEKVKEIGKNSYENYFSPE
jgi:hypothetical protein